MKVNNNPYYNPEDSGLSILDSVDTAGSYEFDMFVVFSKDEDKTLYYDTDSGCSCPVPFEDSVNLIPIDPENLEPFYQALENHYNISKQEVAEIKQSVKNYFREHNKNII